MDRRTVRMLWAGALLTFVASTAVVDYARDARAPEVVEAPVPERPAELPRVTCAQLTAGEVPDGTWLRAVGCLARFDQLVQHDGGIWVALHPSAGSDDGIARVVVRFPDTKMIEERVEAGEVRPPPDPTPAFLEMDPAQRLSLWLRQPTEVPLLAVIAFDARQATLPDGSTAAFGPLRFAPDAVVLHAIPR